MISEVKAEAFRRLAAHGKALYLFLHIRIKSKVRICLPDGLRDDGPGLLRILQDLGYRHFLPGGRIKAEALLLMNFRMTVRIKAVKLHQAQHPVVRPDRDNRHMGSAIIIVTFLTCQELIIILPEFLFGLIHPFLCLFAILLQGVLQLRMVSICHRESCPVYTADISPCIIQNLLIFPRGGKLQMLRRLLFLLLRLRDPRLLCAVLLLRFFPRALLSLFIRCFLLRSRSLRLLHGLRFLRSCSASAAGRKACGQGKCRRENGCICRNSVLSHMKSSREYIFRICLLQYITSVPRRFRQKQEIPSPGSGGHGKGGRPDVYPSFHISCVPPVSLYIKLILAYYSVNPRWRYTSSPGPSELLPSWEQTASGYRPQTLPSHLPR